MNKYLQPIEAELDLHKKTKDEAEKEVLVFLNESRMRGLTKVRIITGRGRHSESGVGILNVFVKEILDRGNYDFQTAKISDGGEGAIEVRL